MENEGIILSIIKEIRDDLRDFRKEFHDHKGECEPRFRILEDNDKTRNAIKNNKKDTIAYFALIISCLSGILLIILNSDKVLAMLK